MMIRNVFVILSLALFFSCKNAVPSGVLKREKMQAVLWDVVRADALANQIIKTDSAKTLAMERAMLTKKVFIIHDVTEEEFRKSYTYYENHPNILKEMLDSINAQQTRNITRDTSITRKRLVNDSAKL